MLTKIEEITALLRSRDSSEDMSRAIDDILNQEKNQPGPVHIDSYSTTQTDVGTPALQAHSPVSLATHFPHPLVICNQNNPCELPAAANFQTYLPSGEPGTNVKPNIAHTAPELSPTLGTSAFISHDCTLQPVLTNLPISTPTSLLAQFPGKLATRFPQPLGFSDKHNPCDEEIKALLRSPENSEDMRTTMDYILYHETSSSELVYIGSYPTTLADFDTSSLQAQSPVDLNTWCSHPLAFPFWDPDSGADEEITTFLRSPDNSEDMAMDDILDQGSSLSEPVYIDSYSTIAADFGTSSSASSHFLHPLAFSLEPRKHH